MKTINILLGTTMLLASVATYADHGHRHERSNPNCVSEFITVLKVENKLASTCSKNRELELTKGYFKYPLMDQSPREVKFWRGSYERVVTKTTTSSSELINTCTGVILRDKTIVDEEKSKLTFKLTNPNLDADIKESYRILPMDDKRAVEAFDRVLRDCEEYELK